MSWWTLEPRDPLMVRDGRPFGVDTEGARSLDFPPPSVLAGALRTRIGFAAREPGSAPFALSPAEAREIRVQGPLLAEIKASGELQLLLPAPRDCVLFDEDTGWRRYQLSPAERWRDGDSSLSAGLLPVAPVAEMPPDKPSRDLPGFWSGETLRRWLSAPAPFDKLALRDTAESLPHERRIHLKIDPGTATGEDGMLFSTDGLRFASRERRGEGWLQHRRALLVKCTDSRLSPGLLTLGGERRLSSLTPAADRDIEWSPPSLKTRRARVLLLTPALFAEGAVPAALMGAKVLAAAVGRPQTLSGWDLAARGPKATRRMAPAGSVYWVELPSDQDPARWAERVHWSSVSSEEQDQLDGFGLAAVGVWS